VLAPAGDTLLTTAGNTVRQCRGSDWGPTIRKELLANAHTREIPIVVVSGSPQELGDLPVECVLTKPVYPDQLVATVHRCLAISKGDLAPVQPPLTGSN
jgi:hypothetical protein